MQSVCCGQLRESVGKSHKCAEVTGQQIRRAGAQRVKVFSAWTPPQVDGVHKSRLLLHVGNSGIIKRFYIFPHHIEVNDQNVSY